MATQAEAIWKDCWRQGQPPVQNLMRIIVGASVVASFWWAIAPTVFLGFFADCLIKKVFHYYSNILRALNLLVAFTIWMLIIRPLLPRGWGRYRKAMNDPSLIRTVGITLFATAGYLAFKIAERFCDPILLKP